jgi:3-hydroxyisobutyrate dehydrogenase-like beta-hydroxyacid dehydrogenase
MVGLGEMGLPMAERMRAASLPVRFYARRAQVAERATALGAIDAGSLPDMAEGSDIVIVCVYTDAEVREVCLGPNGVLAAMHTGATLVNNTTSSPSTARLLAEAAEPLGLHVLDAALSGGPHDIARGALTLLIGGEANVLEQARPALASYSDPILHVGRLGDGQRVKLLNNALFAANLALAVEVERVAGNLGVDPATAINAIAHCSGETRVLRMVGATGSAIGMQERVGRFIRKDVAMVFEVAAEIGIDLGLLGMVAALGGTT